MAEDFYSSEQYFNTLDQLLLAAISPLITETNTVKDYIVSIMRYQKQYKRRKISLTYDWKEINCFLAKFLESPTINNFNNIKLDRGYIIFILQDFLSKTKGYHENYLLTFNQENGYNKLTSIESNILKNKRNDLLFIINHVKFHLEEVYKFKGFILDKFQNYLYSNATKEVNNSPLDIDSDDLIQLYYLALDKAINHFYSGKGAFKTYLDLWMKKASNSSTIYNGSAYNVPSGVNENHLYVNIDSLNINELTENHQDDSLYQKQLVDSKLVLIKDLANVIDPKGYLLEAITLELTS